MASNSRDERPSLAQVPMPTETSGNQPAATNSLASNSQIGSKKRRNHRAGKKKRTRRQSFQPAPDQDIHGSGQVDRPTEPPSAAVARPSLYRLGNSGRGNLSETSLDSEALLDHRYVEFSMHTSILIADG